MPDEVQREVTFHIPAGTETTTTVFRGTMLHLLTSPGSYRKLKDEISQAIAAGSISSPITEAEAKNLSYLHVTAPCLDTTYTPRPVTNRARLC